MKTRTCDKCGKEIKGLYIKCCKAETKDKRYTLNYVGDLCLPCWENIQ